MRLFLACLSVLLASCTTPEQQAQEEQAQAEAYRRYVMAQCKSYGHTPGTPDFKNCLMQVDMANRQGDRAMQNMILRDHIRRSF
jgi:hypothetical protein